MASDLIERLRAMYPVATNRTVPTISVGTQHSITAAPTVVYRNPDGPEAADALTEALARAERAEAECVRLREEAYERQPLSADEVEMFQRALERGWEMPMDPPGKREMLRMASEYLAQRAKVTAAALSELIAGDAHLIEGDK